MPPSEREELVSSLASKIFSAMLDDILMDVALQSKHEVGRSNAICNVCSTRCGLVHVPGTSNTPSHAFMSRPATPASVDMKTLNGSTGTGTNTPTSTKGEGSLLECVNCSRQVASNRYAPHLSACMGLASARRGGIRGNAKAKQPSESGRSVSPESEAGLVSDESRNVKGKGKSKIKRADEAEFNLKRKRLSSPQISPNKKAKKPKGTGPPTSRVKADQDGLGSSYHSSGSQSKIPSKLRDSSTASLVERSPTPSSRSSSPEVASAGTPTSSSFSGQSPTLTSKSVGVEKTLKSKALGIGPPKRLSPPKPPPIHVQTYAIDVEGGDETGSSTDTDSS